MSISRRSLIGGSLAALAGGAASAQTVCDYTNLANPSGVYGLTVTNAFKFTPATPAPPPVPGGNWVAATSRGLWEYAADKGISFGTAIESGLFNRPAVQYSYVSGGISTPTPRTYEWILERECAHFNETSIPAMKVVWPTEAASRNEASYAALDAVVNFATARGKALRLLPLIWYQAMPPWALAYFAPDPPTSGAPVPVTNVQMRNAERLMRSWITGMMGRYRGRVEAWDVVNEAETGVGRNTSDMCSTACVGPWHRTLGHAYIEAAFHIAREVDPKARLVFNEEDLDTDDSWSAGRRTAILRRLERLKSRGVPIDAVGIQAHLSSLHPLNQNIVRDFLRDIASMGYAIEITELGIDDRNFRSTPSAARDDNVGAIVKAYLDAVLDEPNVISITTWGFNDAPDPQPTGTASVPTWAQDGWLNTGARRRCDVEPSVFHPLAPGNNNARRPVNHRSAPFDAFFGQKTFWWALVQAFLGAPAHHKAQRERLRGRVI
jgi:endo-1,4-beta-xylanase